MDGRQTPLRKIAIDKNTTLTAMVRNYLISVARQDSLEKEQAMTDLQDSFNLLSRDMGQRKWKRDDLYGR